MEWIANLLVSQDPTSAPVSIAGTFFTLHDLATVSSAIKSGRTIRCGYLDFSYRGRRSYQEVSRGSDDQWRLQYIAQKSNPQDLAQYQFDVWRHDASGATALMPADFEISTSGGACVARAMVGPFQEVLWGVPAQQMELQGAAQAFELSVMQPRAPYQIGWTWDTVLTKFALDNNGQQNLVAGAYRGNEERWIGLYAEGLHSFQVSTRAARSHRRFVRDARWPKWIIYGCRHHQRRRSAATQSMPHGRLYDARVCSNVCLFQGMDPFRPKHPAVDLSSILIAAAVLSRRVAARSVRQPRQ